MTLANAMVGISVKGDIYYTGVRQEIVCALAPSRGRADGL